MGLFKEVDQISLIYLCWSGWDPSSPCKFYGFCTQPCQCHAIQSTHSFIEPLGQLVISKVVSIKGLVSLLVNGMRNIWQSKCPNYGCQKESTSSLSSTMVVLVFNIYVFLDFVEFFENIFIFKIEFHLCTKKRSDMRCVLFILQAQPNTSGYQSYA